ncbi:MAG: hypothetical protein WA945_04660 [Arcobacteraceae bacterium]
MTLLKILGLTFSQIILSIITIFFVSVYTKNFITMNAINTTSTFDSISLANTFMVFVTFIVVVSTVIITIVGIAYTSWFARQKETILKDNIDDVVIALMENENLKASVLDKILKQPKIRILITQELNTHTKLQKDDFESVNLKINDRITNELNNLEKKIDAKLNKKQNDFSEAAELQKLLKGRD